MPTETKHLHFTLGDNAGQLLATIAQEHLEYNHSPKKAIEAITQSLIGVSLPLAMRILHGDLVLLVDTNEKTGEQNFIATEFIDGVHDKLGFRKLETTRFAKRKTAEIFSTGKGLAHALELKQASMSRGSISINFSYDQILDFIGGDEKRVLDELRYDANVSELEMLIRVSKNYIERSVEDLAVVHFMKTTWPEDFTDDHEDDQGDARLMLKDVMESLSDLLKNDFSKVLKETEDLDRFIEATREIDTIISAGIEPVDIMNNWDAGWLAPNGDYYALNGEIANMLHNQIADALYEKGIVPEGEENKVNPDNWLHGEGWVKIHKENILFEANINEKIGRGPNRFMTDVQINKIKNYCQVHHGGLIKLMFQPMSAVRFEMEVQNDPFAFYRKYFMGE